ncbi:MAG: HAMP domain-containing protein [Pseudodesulfovibrio sp.]|nr:HAMP domain-containing protein [Pseudodesulfovibrio sp.]
MKLGVKMTMFCLLVGVLPLAGMAGYSLHAASGSMKFQAYDKLASLKEAKLHDLNELTKTWNKDITMYSEARYVYSALVRLRDIVFYAAEPGKSMDVNNEEYVHAMKRVEAEFRPWIAVRGYADALILDDTGRIVFSVKKGRELGEDLVRGPLAKSRLAKAWKHALKGDVVFVDFHPYEPLDGEPCAFVATPIRRNGQEIEGVAMLRIPLASVNGVMSTRAGMGDTGEAYLVGPDMLMRSDLFSDPKQHSLRASFAAPDMGSMTTIPVVQALAGKTGSMETLDYRGRAVLAAFAPVAVGADIWALVAKVDAVEAFAPVRRLENAAMIVGATSVAVIILVTLVFLRFALLSPLDRLRIYAGRVSGGDLDARPEGLFRGELKQVRDAIERMVRNLADKMQEAEGASQLALTRATEAEAALIRARRERQQRMDDARAQREGMLKAAGMLEGVVVRMTEASATVNDESDRIMRGATSLNKRVELTATSMEQLAGSIREVADNAETASSEAVMARQRAREGSEVVRRAMDSIGEVHAITAQLRGKMSELGSKADSIDKVMNVISDIADQTNLLALNAAIEAARAGKSGRGFAVVADEVRKLAVKTMDATREVGGSISAIQSGVRENMQGMEQAAYKVDTANELAGESGKALGEIMEFFDSTLAQIQAIATASCQQSSAGDEINKAVAEVDTVSSKTVEAVGQTGVAIDDLTGQIENLSKLYGLFMVLGEGQVQEDVVRLASLPGIVSMDSFKQREILERAVRENPCLELARIMDATGRQVTDSVYASDSGTGRSLGRPGVDWSHHDWFSEPMRTGETYLSGIYHSGTVGDYCLTVSTPIRTRGGTLLGILAVDVRHASLRSALERAA